MDRQKHLEVDRALFGEEHNSVHQWLDHSLPDFKDTNPYKHWLGTHDCVSIGEQFGVYTVEYNVAYVHILMDFLSHFNRAYVPIDLDACETMLKKVGVL